MIIRTREEWRAALAPVDADTPILVELVPGGPAERPWQPGATIKGIGICHLLDDNLWKAYYVPLAHEGEQNAEPLILHDILLEMGRRPLYVEDANEFTLQTVARIGALFPVAYDKLVAKQLLAFDAFEDSTPARFPDVPVDEWHDRLGLRLAVLYDEIAMLRTDIETLGFTVPYAVEVHSRQVLARSTAHGYAHSMLGRVHPTWHTIHATGSGLVTSRGPSLTSTTKADRHRYPADSGFRWAEVRWPAAHFQTAVLAARSESPWLAKAAQDEPLARLAELWGTSETAAEAILMSLTATGPNETAFVDKGGNPDVIRALAKVAPEWVQWGAVLTEQARIDGSITSFLKRRIRVDEPRKACALDVQTTQSTLLKMLISRLHVGAAQQPNLYAGFHCVLPVYSKVAYQIDEHVPVAAHIQAAKLTGQLFPAANIQLRTEVYMGPTWGALERVDLLESVQAQAAQDLGQPGRLPAICPQCGRVAPDEATLRQHITDEHTLAAQR